MLCFTLLLTILSILLMIIPLTPRSRPRQQATQKKIPVRNISIIIIIRIGTVGGQKPIATQFLRFGIILVFVIIIIISSIYVYVYRCKIGNKNSLHFTSHMQRHSMVSCLNHGNIIRYNVSCSYSRTYRQSFALWLK